MHGAVWCRRGAGGCGKKTRRKEKGKALGCTDRDRSRLPTSSIGAAGTARALATLKVKAVPSLSHPPVHAEAPLAERRAPSLSPRSPPPARGTAVPSHPPALPSEAPSRRLGTFGCSPKAIFVHKARGRRGLSHAARGDESLFSAASGRKAARGPEAGPPVPPPAASGTAAPLFRFRRQKGGVLEGVKDIMVVPKVRKEQCEEGRLGAGEAGARRGLIGTRTGLSPSLWVSAGRGLPLGLSRCAHGWDSGSGVPISGTWGSHAAWRHPGEQWPRSHSCCLAPQAGPRGEEGSPAAPAGNGLRNTQINND